MIKTTYTTATEPTHFESFVPAAKAPSYGWLFFPIVGWLVFAMKWTQYRALKGRAQPKPPARFGEITDRANALYFLTKQQKHLKIEQTGPFIQRLSGDLHLFREVNLGLARKTEIILPSRKKAESAGEIYEALGEGDEALRLMPFMQQGVFADLLERAERELGTFGQGMEGQYRLANSGSMLEEHYTGAGQPLERITISKENGKFVLNGYGVLQIQENKTDEHRPLAIVRIEFKVNSEEASSSWSIEKVASDTRAVGA